VFHEGTKVTNNLILARYDPSDFTLMTPIPANTVGVVTKLGIMKPHTGVVISVFRVDFEGYGPSVFSGERIDELTIVDNHEEGTIWGRYDIQDAR
jgi:hypothetical protein